jgi:HEPN domain-containing protein
MIDVDKHIHYWQSGAQEEWELAIDLIGKQRIRHALFFAHLTLEKILKAHVVKATGDVAPRIHNLHSLASISQLQLSADQIDHLKEMNLHNIEGRYPDLLAPEPALEQAHMLMDQTEDMYKWLLNQL